MIMTRVQCQQSSLRFLLVLLFSHWSHCHGQERPSIVVPVPSNDGGDGNDQHLYRTNVCDRQLQLSNSALKLRDALVGVNLTVAMRTYLPERKLFALDEEGRIPTRDPGLFVELLDELAGRAGFTWRNSFAATDGLLDNEHFQDWTLTDVLEHEITNFDISMELWYQTNERKALGISFPRGWFIGGIVMGRDDAAFIDKNSVLLSSHLWPFEPDVWLLLVAFIFLNGIVFYIVEHVYLQDDRSQLLEEPLGESRRQFLEYSGRSKSSQQMQISAASHINDSAGSGSIRHRELQSGRSSGVSSQYMSRRRLLIDADANTSRPRQHAILADDHNNDADYDDDSISKSVPSVPDTRDDVLTDESQESSKTLIIESEQLDLLVYSIFLSALSAMGTYSFEPISGTTRLLCFSLSFWALIMTSAYTANLASAFVFQRTRTNLVDIDDFLKTATPICVLRGSPIAELILKDYPDAILVRKDTEAEMFFALRDSFETDDAGRYVGCGVTLSTLADVEQFQVQTIFNPSCTVTTNRRQILPFPSGMATAIDASLYCTSLISYVLDLHIREMQADRSIDRLWVNHLEALATNDCGVAANGGGGVSLSPQSTSGPVDSKGRIHINKKADTDSLDFQDMAGIFLTHWTVSIAVLLANYIRFRRRTKKGMLS